MAEFNLASAKEIRHFSHAHTLELTSLRGEIGSYCRGCIKPIEEGLVYRCKPCNFLFHISCSQIPEKINHPADSRHALDLLSQPWEYGESPCRCNACWQPIRQGFSFHCTTCRLDLHPSCANLPMKIKHQNHPQHSLALCFIPPYPSKAFTCNVCKKVDQRSWHYHCSECHFDAHVNCTQIPSLREALLNHTSQEINQAYVHYSGGHMGGHMPTSSGPTHFERSFNEPPRLFPVPRPSLFHSSYSFQMQQQQRPPFQLPYSMTGNMFVKPAISAIMQTVVGSILNFFMNPGGGGGGGDGWGVLGGLNSLGDPSDIMESMFSFGFF